MRGHRRHTPPVLLTLVLLLGSCTQLALCRWRSPVSTRIGSDSLSRLGRSLQQLPIQLPSIFDISGFIEEATVDSDPKADPLVGGKITVNGHVITVPSSTIVILPANALTWAELFTHAPFPYTNTATGMALKDSPTPLGSYEAHVQGNRVGDTYIAALIWISQNFLNAGAGYINHIDYTKGEMLVGAMKDDPTHGARVRINDPAININGTKTGRYSLGLSPDPRFQVDQDNPTIIAATGFPMCIPRSVDANNASTDSLCPEYNRPLDTTGHPATIINMPDPALGTRPDARQQAPFKVGDYITFLGTLVTDSPDKPTVAGSATTFYISAHTIVGNVAIFTAPKTNPAYVMIDVSIVGTGGPIIPGAAEAAIKDRYEGMTTDPTRGIHLWALDYDPATGQVTDRDYGTIGVDPGPPTGAVRGRWKYQPPCNAIVTNFKVCTPPKALTFLPPPREVRAVLEDSSTFEPAWKPGQTTTYANGLLAGQYHAPIAEYVFPENIPGTPVREANVNGMPFLANGGYSSSTGTIAKPLNPWPSSVLPSSVCSDPVAKAGGPYTVSAGGSATLDGSMSTGTSLAYSWALVLPALGNLTMATSAKAMYTAPTNVSGVDQIILTLSSPCGSTSMPTSVTINAPKAPTVTPVQPLTLASGQSASINLAGTAPNGGSLTFSITQAPTTPALSNLAIQSTGALTATATFNAPTVPVGQATPTVLQLSITASDSMKLVSAPVLATVTIQPQADTLTATAATYSTKQTRISITVVSSITQPMTPPEKITLGPYATRAGTFDPSSVGPNANVFSPGGPAGTYTLSLAGAPLPTSTVRVTSNLGGKVDVALTRIK